MWNGSRFELLYTVVLCRKELRMELAVTNKGEHGLATTVSILFFFVQLQWHRSRECGPPVSVILVQWYHSRAPSLPLSCYCYCAIKEGTPCNCTLAVTW